MHTKPVNHYLLPVLLGIITSLVIILIIHPVIDRFEATLVNKEVSDYFAKGFADLDGDGESEELKFKQDKEMSIFYLFKGDGIFDQWNFPGQFARHNFHFTGDFDGDGFSEIFIINYIGDSICINAIQPMGKHGPGLLKKKNIDRYYLKDGWTLDGFYFHGLIDLDADGYKELIFSIFAGTNKKPRKVYRWNIRQNTIHRSALAGTSMYKMVTIDTSQVRSTFLYGKVPAFGNIKPADSVPYSDSTAWVMVYNDTLGYAFNPIPYGSYPANIELYPGFPPEQDIIGLYKGIGTRNKLFRSFSLSFDGDLFKEKDLPGWHPFDEAWLRTGYPDKGTMQIVYDDGTIMVFDREFNVIDSSSVTGITWGRTFAAFDIDRDGLNELVYRDNSLNKLRIFRNDLSNPVLIDVEDNRSIRNISGFSKKDGTNYLFITNENYEYTYRYQANTGYSLNFAIYAGLFIISVLAFTGLQQMFQYRLRKVYEAQKEVSRLQVNAIKSQLDPHFTLNLINSISALFYKDQKENTTFIFDRYTRMLREVIISSDEIYIEISRELDFCRNYLELEKFRYDDKFDYSIEVAEDVDTEMKIPKMIIHTFVENAVKHGIKHLSANGMIRITVGMAGGRLLITVTDNGLGRDYARNHELPGTGKGLRIIDEMIALYRKLERKTMKYEIIDLYDPQDTANGTQVKIFVEI